MVDRVRIKRPEWATIVTNSSYTLAIVQNTGGANLYMLTDGACVDIVDALGYAKNITGEAIPITSLGVYGGNGMPDEYRVNVILYPLYTEAADLCLCFTHNSNIYAIGLDNNEANCY